MKKLLTLLFTFALAFSLAMPVFASQENTGNEPAPKAEKKEVKKSKKVTHHKRMKRSKKAAAKEEAPKQQ
jgi:hypothetical protein